MTCAQRVANMAAKNIALRMEYQIRICIKPKPRWISERSWLKLASLFIYVERTQLPFKLEEK